MNGVTTERLDDFELRLRMLESELRELRAAAAPRPAPAPVEPKPEPQPAMWPPPRPPARQPDRVAAEQRAPRRTIEDVLAQADLLGARGLAVAGGIVMLLGIAFFFVLAANRGWIGPGARIALGAVASGGVFAAGLVLRHRFGQLHSALAAVGVGIAGGYTTLLAATALYDLVPEAVALLVAAAIASLGVAVAVAWSSELVAALGLVGAAALPALDALDHGSTATGVAFVAIVLAAAGVVSVWRDWPVLLGGAATAAIPQAAALALVADESDAGAIASCAMTALVLLGSAVARQLRGADDELDGLAGSLALLATGLALASALALLPGGGDRGIALFVAAGVEAAVAALCVRRSRDLATLVGAGALALAAVATADVLSAATLTMVWAAQSVLLTALAERLRQPRFRLAGLVYLAGALIHGLAVEAPPGRLFDVLVANPADGAPGVAAVAAACLVAALAGRFEPDAATGGPLAFVGELIDLLAARRRGLRTTLLAAGAALGLYAASLVLVEASFDDGHVAVTALWALAGLAAVAVGARLRDAAWCLIGGTALLLVLVKNVSFDWDMLGDERGAVALLFAAAAVLLAGFALPVLWESTEPLVVGSALAAATALVSAIAAIGSLVESTRPAAAPMLGVTLAYLGLAAGVFRVPRLRTLATVLWAHGLAALLITEALAVDDRLVVLAFAATGAALALLARPLAEPRLHRAGLLVSAGTTVGTLAFLTPPQRLLEATSHPGASLWALAACVAAVLVLALTDDDHRDRLAAVTAALGVFALSLGILELAERLSGASVQTDFERGHTAVSALWGLIGLGLVVAGLLRRSGRLRLAGLGLFGLALAKLFLYDLSALSSITRALSFLAVGGFLLAAGFFLQRLSEKVAGVEPAANGG